MSGAQQLSVDVVVSDAAVRESTRILLDVNQYTGRDFASGTEYILANPQPDCLLTDRVLTDMTGIDLLEHLRVSGDETPAVMMTGRIDTDTASRAKRLSLNLLEKPALTESLLGSIQKACVASMSRATESGNAMAARFPAGFEDEGNGNWIDKAGTGVAVFDAEHRTLNEMVIDYYDAILAAESEAALRDLWQKLSTYTDQHFAHEENYMRFSGFEDGGRHIDSHRRLRVALQTLPTIFDLNDENRAFVALQVLRFLKHWLIDHIVTADRALGVYLNSKGIR